MDLDKNCSINEKMASGGDDNKIVEKDMNNSLLTCNDISNALASPKANKEYSMTPRRSARKSVKPIQDYSEIVSQMCLRSNNKDQSTKDHENKWTPKKVGRTSTKRGKRARKTILKQTQNDSDENKENNVDAPVKPQDSSDEQDHKENLEEMVDIDKKPTFLGNINETKPEIEVESEDSKSAFVKNVGNSVDKILTSSSPCATELCEPLPQENKAVDMFETENILNTTFDATVDECIYIPTEIDRINLDSEEDNEDIEVKSEIEMFTAAEPKEIVLRSIRKRSKSMCLEVPNKKAGFRVCFNSDANETVIFNENETILHSVANDQNVTKRRKRSLSCHAQTPLKSSMPLKDIKPAATAKGTINKTSPGTKKNRTKLPNFAAIHQKSFSKMENLVQHLERKAERAKKLTNSGKKIIEAGMASKIPLNKSVKDDKIKAIRKLAVENEEDPATISVKNTNMKGNLNKSKNMANNQLLRSEGNVGTTPTKSRNYKDLLAKAAPSVKAINDRLALHNSISIASKIARPIISVKPTTTFSKNPTATEIFAMNNTMPTPYVEPSVSTNRTMIEDKVVARRQRHMNMFKGRGDIVEKRANKNRQAIQGVRSNRRFELLMEFRKKNETK